MIRMTIKVCVAVMAALAACAAPGHAGEFGHRAIRYGYTSAWPYDNRDDHRDFASNGVFPGNFAAQPYLAWIGAGGIAGSTPQRSVAPYPSQVVFGAASPRRRPRR